MSEATLVHPHVDVATDADRFRVADPLDPRFLGEGPCRGLHQRQLESWEGIHPFEKLGGNPCSRYTECNRCRLRVRYWPKAHATSHTMNNISPHAVRAILAALYDKGVREEMTWQDFMRETQLYEAKLKADGQLITDAVKRERKQAADDAKAEKAAAKAAAKAKAVPKCAATPAPRMQGRMRTSPRCSATPSTRWRRQRYREQRRARSRAGRRRRRRRRRRTDIIKDQDHSLGRRPRRWR